MSLSTGSIALGVAAGTSSVSSKRVVLTNLSHGLEGLHLKGGELVSRWLALPHALALGKLLHQALKVCVRK